MMLILPLKVPITTAADDDILANFRKQPILMKYHALFVIFEKRSKILDCHLLQIIGGALRAK